MGLEGSHVYVSCRLLVHFFCLLLNEWELLADGRTAETRNLKKKKRPLLHRGDIIGGRSRYHCPVRPCLLIHPNSCGQKLVDIIRTFSIHALNFMRTLGCQYQSRNYYYVHECHPSSSIWDSGYLSYRDLGRKKIRAEAVAFGIRISSS